MRTRILTAMIAALTLAGCAEERAPTPVAAKEPALRLAQGALVGFRAPPTVSTPMKASPQVR